MRTIKDLYNRLDKDEQNLVASLIAIEDLSNFNFERKTIRLHQPGKTIDNITTEELLDKLSNEAESYYFFITANKEWIDHKLKHHKFWDREENPDSRCDRVVSEHYSFNNEKDANHKITVGDLIEQLDKLYNGTSKISDNLRLQIDNNVCTYSGVHDVNRVLYIAECLDILRVVLRIHPELKQIVDEEQNKIKGRDDKSYNSGRDDTIVYSPVPLKEICLDAKMYGKYVAKKPELENISSDNDKLNFLLSIIENHYLEYKDFYEKKPYPSIEIMFSIIASDVIDQNYREPAINKPNKLALDRVFHSSDEAWSFVNKVIYKNLAYRHSSLMEADDLSSIEGKINELSEEIDWSNFSSKDSTGKKMSKYYCTQFLCILLSGGSKARKDYVDYHFGRGGIRIEASEEPAYVEARPIDAITSATENTAATINPSKRKLPLGILKSLLERKKKR